MSFQTKAKVLYNKRIKRNYFEISLDSVRIAKTASPGQFVEIKVSDDIEPLLRRPFSIHRIAHKLVSSQAHKLKTKKYIVILYEVVGKATEILSQRKAGEYLDILGPLGNGFDYHTPYTIHHTPILVAGGMGTAPLIFLAEKLVTKSQSHKVTRKPLALIGGKTKEDILCEKEFRELGYEVKIATDDGSVGFKGYVSNLLEKMLKTDNRKLTTIYACGPKPMLKEISIISERYHIPAQISLEAHLACGIGACMGCVIKSQKLKVKSQNDNLKSKSKNQELKSEFEYKRVCKDGPVFEASQIIW